MQKQTPKVSKTIKQPKAATTNRPATETAVDHLAIAKDVLANYFGVPAASVPASNVVSIAAAHCNKAGYKPTPIPAGTDFSLEDVEYLLGRLGDIAAAHPRLKAASDLLHEATYGFFTSNEDAPAQDQIDAPELTEFERGIAEQLDNVKTSTPLQQMTADFIRLATIQRLERVLTGEEPAFQAIV